MKTIIRLKIITLTCLVAWLGQPEVKAQTATVVNGYPVIDITALSPLECTLTLAEANSRRAEMYACTPANDALLTGDVEVSGSYGTWNAKMSARYQVMRNDLGGSGTKKNWVDAWNGCKAYSGEGGTAGTWRLPTIRELQMIWILHPQLIGKGSFTAISLGLYWSSSESKANSPWYVSHYGTTDQSYIKTDVWFVRCIRDI